MASTPTIDDINAFAAGPADLAVAKGLKGSDEKALLALVGNLEDGRKRDHLEVLGAAGLGKLVQKAARKAAYKLKSAGIVGEAVKATAIDLSVRAELDKVAIAGAPGLDGHVWLVLSSLPGTAGAVVDLRKPGEPATCEVIEDLARGRLKRSLGDSGTIRPALVDAGAAIRVIDFLDAWLPNRAGGAPPSWSHVLDWRAAAVRFGAEPEAADARRALDGADAPTEQEIEQLFDTVRVGHMIPPQAIVERMEHAVHPLLHDDAEIEEQAFADAITGFARETADAWLAEDDKALSHVATWLDVDADLLYAAGEERLAVACLALADAARAHEGAGSDWVFLREACARVIDGQAAWAHRQAHVAGHAHH